VELPEVRNLRVDLLGETPEGELVHIELQSTNDSDMALRMAEYSLAICRRFGRMPAQVILYVGYAPASMKTSLEGPHLSFACPILDARDMDGEPWLSSTHGEESILAILMRSGTEIDTIRRILRRISEADRASRPTALAELFILARLRKIADIIEREAQQVPILEDIMDHEVFGPLIRQGRAEGTRDTVLRLLARRFGPLPEWARSRIESMSANEIDLVTDRLLDAPSLNDLLP